eukprot:5090171-Amphidinium_carterae.1
MVDALSLRMRSIPETLWETATTCALEQNAARWSVATSTDSLPLVSCCMQNLALPVHLPMYGAACLDFVHCLPAGCIRRWLLTAGISAE